jgi:hypothetical protein
MPNIFKTQKHDRKDNKDNNKENKDKTYTDKNKVNMKCIFKTKINPNETFNIKELDLDFPELEKINKPENKFIIENNIDLNFKEASLKENITDKDDSYENLIPNGWTIYRMIDNKIVIDGHLKNKPKKNYHSMAFRTFNFMINKWDNYKNFYDELHGFGEYDRLYKIPNNSFIENEDSEDSEDYYEYFEDSDDSY